MNNLLNEELRNFRKLSNYNPKMTLTENFAEMGEAYGVGTDVESVRAALGDAKTFEQLMKDLKVTDMSVADIGVLLKKTPKQFDAEMIKAFEKDLKSGWKAGELGPEGKKLSKINVIYKIGQEGKGDQATIDKIIEDVKSANKERAAKYKGKVPTTKPKPDPADVDKAVTKYPWMKNLTWKLLRKRGLQIGIPLAVLYGIYKLTHDDEPPLPPGPTPNPDPVPPTPNPDPNSGRYHVCTGTYTKSCKTDPTGAIGQVQKCLGLVVDGKFWDKTQDALVAKGFANGFKDSDITTICGGTPPPPTPDPDTIIDNSDDLVADTGV